MEESWQADLNAEREQLLAARRVRREAMLARAKSQQRESRARNNRLLEEAGTIRRHLQDLLLHDTTLPPNSPLRYKGSPSTSAPPTISIKTVDTTPSVIHRAPPSSVRPKSGRVQGHDTLLRPSSSRTAASAQRPRSAMRKPSNTEDFAHTLERARQVAGLLDQRPSTSNVHSAHSSHDGRPGTAALNRMQMMQARERRQQKQRLEKEMLETLHLLKHQQKQELALHVARQQGDDDVAEQTLDDLLDREDNPTDSEADSAAFDSTADMLLAAKYARRFRDHAHPGSPHKIDELDVLGAFAGSHRKRGDSHPSARVLGANKAQAAPVSASRRTSHQAARPARAAGKAPRVAGIEPRTLAPPYTERHVSPSGPATKLGHEHYSPAAATQQSQAQKEAAGLRHKGGMLVHPARHYDAGASRSSARRASGPTQAAPHDQDSSHHLAPAPRSQEGPTMVSDDEESVFGVAGPPPDLGRVSQTPVGKRLSKSQAKKLHKQDLLVADAGTAPSNAATASVMDSRHRPSNVSAAELDQPPSPFHVDVSPVARVSEATVIDRDFESSSEEGENADEYISTRSPDRRPDMDLSNISKTPIGRHLTGREQRRLSEPDSPPKSPNKRSSRRSGRKTSSTSAQSGDDDLETTHAATTLQEETTPRTLALVRNSEGKFGVTVVALRDDDLHQLVISAIKPSAIVEAGQLQVGDAIVAVNDKRVGDDQQVFYGALKATPPGERLWLQVQFNPAYQQVLTRQQNAEEAVDAPKPGNVSSGSHRQVGHSPELTRSGPSSGSAGTDRRQEQRASRAGAASGSFLSSQAGTHDAEEESDDTSFDDGEHFQQNRPEQAHASAGQQPSSGQRLEAGEPSPDLSSSFDDADFEAQHQRQPGTQAEQHWDGGRMAPAAASAQTASRFPVDEVDLTLSSDTLSLTEAASTGGQTMQQPTDANHADGGIGDDFDVETHHVADRQIQQQQQQQQQQQHEDDVAGEDEEKALRCAKRLASHLFNRNASAVMEALRGQTDALSSDGTAAFMAAEAGKPLDEFAELALVVALSKAVARSDLLLLGDPDVLMDLLRPHPPRTLSEAIPDMSQEEEEALRHILNLCAHVSRWLVASAAASDGAADASMADNTTQRRRFFPSPKRSKHKDSVEPHDVKPLDSHLGTSVSQVVHAIVPVFSPGSFDHPLSQVALEAANYYRGQCLQAGAALRTFVDRVTAQADHEAEDSDDSYQVLLQSSSAGNSKQNTDASEVISLVVTADVPILLRVLLTLGTDADGSDEAVAKSLMLLAVSTHAISTLVTEAVFVEVTSTPSESTILRQNSLATRIIGLTCRFEAASFFKTVLSKTVRHVQAEPSFFFVESPPSNKKKTKPKTLLRSMTMLVDSLLADIERDSMRPPMLLALVLRELRAACCAWYPAVEARAAASLLFLRTLAPVLMQPYEQGLTDGPVSDETSFALKCVANVVNNISQHKCFDKERRPDYAALNELVTSNRERILRILDNISAASFDESAFEKFEQDAAMAAADTLAHHSRVVALFLKSHMKPILEALGQTPSDVEKDNKELEWKAMDALLSAPLARVLLMSGFALRGDDDD